MSLQPAFGSLCRAMRNSCVCMRVVFQWIVLLDEFLVYSSVTIYLAWEQARMVPPLSGHESVKVKTSKTAIFSFDRIWRDFEVSKSNKTMGERDLPQNICNSWRRARRRRLDVVDRLLPPPQSNSPRSLPPISRNVGGLPGTILLSFGILRYSRPSSIKDKLSKNGACAKWLPALSRGGPPMETVMVSNKGPARTLFYLTSQTTSISYMTKRLFHHLSSQEREKYSSRPNKCRKKNWPFAWSYQLVRVSQ